MLNKLSRRVRVLLFVALLVGVGLVGYVGGVQAGIPGWVDRKVCDFIEVDGSIWIECEGEVRGSFVPFE